MHDTTPTEPGTLLARTRTLLKRDTRSLAEIHAQGALPFYWLKKFSANVVSDPGVNRVQKLYEFLTNKKLPL